MSLSPESIAELLHPYIAAAPKGCPEVDWSRIHQQLAIYLELILKWNSRVNLTAIHAPDEIVRRHFGESLFAGLHLGPCSSLLDYGSGAGFPGLPIQLLLPGLPVTLAESRQRKAAFLREVVRELRLDATVWNSRVEDLPAEFQFHTVTLRAVEDMPQAVQIASARAQRQILILGTSSSLSYLDGLAGFRPVDRLPMPRTGSGLLIRVRRS